MGMYESFVNCESVVAAEAALAILEVRNQQVFGHKNLFRDAVNQVDGTKVLEEMVGGGGKVVKEVGVAQWSSGAWAPLPVSTGRESVVVKTLEVLDQEVVASAGKRSPFCTRVAVGALLRSHPLDGWKEMATGKCGRSDWNWHAKAKC